MPRSRCAVPTCNNNNYRNDRTHKFFCLPRNVTRAKLWMQLIGRIDIHCDQKFAKHYHVCDVHFDPLMIENGRLKEYALPIVQVPAVTLKTLQHTSRKAFNPGSALNFVYSNYEDKFVQTDYTMPLVEIDKIDDKKEKKQKLMYNLRTVIKKINRKISAVTPSNDVDVFKELCDKLLTSDAASYAVDQMILHNGKRENEYKLFALNLYYAFSKTYKSLRKPFCLLPKATLKKPFLSSSTTISEHFVKVLKAQIHRMDETDKICAICVDEMSLKANLFYDVNQDKVVGFHELNGNQRTLPATRAIVLMAKGIYSDWTLPIAYTFLANSQVDHELVTWIDEVITKLLDIGLNVCSFTCDLKSDFIDYCIKKDVTIDKPYFSVKSKEIFFVFDAPDLVKCVRNNLMSYNFHFETREMHASQPIEHVAQWEHIKSFYEMDKLNKLSLCYKLTNAHINPNKLERSRVDLAAQIFSDSVASALEAYVALGYLNRNVLDTAIFIRIINNLFDLLNSTSVKSKKASTQPLTLNILQREFVIQALKLFKNMKIVNSNVGIRKDFTKSTKFLRAIQITLNSISQLHEKLCDSSTPYLLTGRFSQDDLRNLFGEIRLHHREPTPIQFTRAFRKIMFAKFTKLNENCNRTTDIDQLMISSFNYDHSYDLPEKKTNDTLTISNVTRDYGFEMPPRNAFVYVCGYFLFKCEQHHVNCTDFTDYISAGKQDDVNLNNMFVHFRTYNTKASFYGCLKMPPADFIKYIEKLNSIFKNYLQPCRVLNSSLGNDLLAIMQRVPFKMFCECFPRKFLIILFIRFRIYHTLKYNNRNFRNTAKNIQKFFCVLSL